MASTEEQAILNARNWLKPTDAAPAGATPPAAPAARAPKRPRKDEHAAPAADATPSNAAPAADATPSNATPAAGAAPSAAPALPNLPAFTESDDTTLPDDPAELQALIDAARAIDARVMRVFGALTDLETNSVTELDFLRRAPALFVEPGITALSQAAAERSGEDAAYLAALTRALLEEQDA